MKPYFASAVWIACSCLGVAVPEVPIYEIQGAGHESPFVGTRVQTSGHITQIHSTGFYLQDAVGDGDAKTSDGIFVATGTKVEFALHDWVQLEADVVEHVPGGTATQNLSVTRLENPLVLPPVVDPPTWNPQGGVVIGEEGILPPHRVVKHDDFQSFEP